MNLFRFAYKVFESSRITVLPLGNPGSVVALLVELNVVDVSVPALVRLDAVYCEQRVGQTYEKARETGGTIEHRDDSRAVQPFPRIT